MTAFVGPEHLTPEQWELECTMLELCEELHAATWVTGFEYELWGLLVAGRRDWPRVVRAASPEEAATTQLELLESIRTLSEKTGCWIVIEDDMSSHPVPLERWRRIYEQSGWRAESALRDREDSSAPS